jgi:preprotein translocase subunit SecA
MAALLLGKSELENLELTQSQFTNSIIRAQKQMEGRHFGIRKHLFDYDSVIDKQRQAIYHKRDEIIESEENPEIKTLLIEEMRSEIERNMGDIVRTQIHTAQTLNQSATEFIQTIDKVFSLKLSNEEISAYENMSYEQLQKPLTEQVTKHIQHNMQSIDQERMYLILKDVYLYHIDTLRVKHIDEMDYLRDKVGLMGYAQLDPLVVYKKEAFDKFQNLLYNLKLDISTYIAGIDFAGIQQQEELQKIRITNQAKDNQYVQLLQKVSQNVKVTEKKASTSPKTSESTQKMVYENQDGFEIFETKDGEPTGVPETHVIDMNPNQKTRPNDPCPCGSGKKFKKCCSK